MTDPVKGTRRAVAPSVPSWGQQARFGTYFEQEVDRFDTYLPEDQTLAEITTPVQIVSDCQSSWSSQAS